LAYSLINIAAKHRFCIPQITTSLRYFQINKSLMDLLKQNLPGILPFAQDDNFFSQDWALERIRHSEPSPMPPLPLLALSSRTK
jgi:hypothetical protein